MTKLSQILAVEKGVKSRALAELSELHHASQKAPLWGGITRTYEPKDDEGDRLPAEFTQVQLNADAHLTAAAATLTRLFDVVATKDRANTGATADVVIDGTALLARVPVTYLLFLEKQLTDLRTFVGEIPVLDAATTWSFDETAGVWQTAPVGTTRSSKVPRNHVLAEATKEHPAQVNVWTEDVIVGTWTTRKLSGGLPATRKATLLARVDALGEAVKFAREEANTAEVQDEHVGKRVFDYLFA